MIDVSLILIKLRVEVKNGTWGTKKVTFLQPCRSKLAYSSVIESLLNQIVFKFAG